MEYSDISPRYLTELKSKLTKKIHEEYSSDDILLTFMVNSASGWDRFYDINDPDDICAIYYLDDERTKVDVKKTVLYMPPDETVKMAIDLGIDTPGFIPSIPKFKNVLKDENQTAYQNFQRAVKNVYDNPDEAVQLASSTLEGIMKTILADAKFKNTGKKQSQAKLVKDVVEWLGIGSNNKSPKEIKTIASQLRGLGEAIDSMRSNMSSAHGKLQSEYIVDDPLWAGLVVNASATLGLFLWEYYEKKYRPASEKGAEDEPISPEDIPF